MHMVMNMRIYKNKVFLTIRLLFSSIELLNYYLNRSKILFLITDVNTRSLNSKVS